MKEKKIIYKVIIILTIVILLLTTCYILFKKVIYPLSYFDIVKEEAIKNNLDPYLVMGIIKTESGFKKYATSNKDAKGLMQIMDSTASDINKEINIVNDINDNLYHENVNIAFGCKYFSNLINKYNGNYYLAICAYNAGMGNVDNWIEEGVIDKNLNQYIDIDLPFDETEKYLKKVLATYHMYKVIYK